MTDKNTYAWLRGRTQQIRLQATNERAGSRPKESGVLSVIKHYATLYQGAFVGYTSDVEVPNRIDRPEGNFYAWNFYDRECAIINGEELLGKKKNYSEMNWIGEKVSLQQIGYEHGEGSILYDNIKGNGYSYVIKTKFGPYYLLSEKDVVHPK